MKKLSQKRDREKEVLFGLIETFLESGKPVGSNTLKETGFEHLSAATIRNYFAKLEEEGFLEQQHSSGGRIPSEKAFRLYAQEFVDQAVLDTPTLEQIEKIQHTETKEVALLIRDALEELSRIAGVPAFISSPKFDQDFVTAIKILPLDARRVLIALLTDFGSVQTEILFTEHKLSSFSAKRIEAYLQARLSGQSPFEPLKEEEEEMAGRFYNEVIVRFFVGHVHFSQEEVLRTGFSKLLGYLEFRDASALIEALALFENVPRLRHILRDTMAHKELKFWIGKDLVPFGSKSHVTSVLAIPYFINTAPIGAFGILGPTRIPYRRLFGILKAMSQSLSHAITNNLYKFQVTYRQPEYFKLPGTKIPRIGHKPLSLIESKKGI